MKKVLLTTDFSENARVAIDYGLQLFGADDVTYTLLNTYKEPGSSTAAMVSIADYLHKESKTLLESTVKDLRQKYPNHAVEPLSLHGSLYPAINNFAKREDADIVVIGTRGATQVQNFFLGSNTMDVMRHSSIPAVIIPQAYSYEPIERIALAVDIKPIKHISILDPILDIAASKDASVHAFHIQENGNDEMSIDSQKVKRLFEACGSIAHTFDNIKSENVAAGIGSYVKDNGASMLALVARKHNFIERLFQKSITKEVSFLASFPMVIVRER